MINWRIRFRNKAWLAAFLAAIIQFGCRIMSLLGVELPIQENELLEAASTLVSLLVLLGVVVDPTTQGVSDSARAMGYE